MTRLHEVESRLIAFRGQLEAAESERAALKYQLRVWIGVTLTALAAQLLMLIWMATR